jgi:outer membrane protein assembly factor BamB
MMYRGDLARDGHPATAALDPTMAARLKLSWRTELDGAIDGTPAVAEGLVLAGSAAGTLAAFDASSGSRRWQRSGLGTISGSPTVTGDRVIAGSLAGRVYAFALANGGSIWSWQGPANAAVWASPVAYGDEVIVGVSSPYGDNPLVPGRLFGLDALSGHERWSMCVRAGCEPGGGIWSTPAIDQRGVGFVGVGNPDDGVLAFDASTGARKWLRNLYADNGRDLDVGATPVIFNLGGREVVAQASVEGLFAVLDASTGDVVWSREVVGGSAVHGLIASPAYDGTSLYVGSASPPTGMFALAARDGTVTWRHATAEPVYSAPAVGNGVLVFGTGAVFGDLKSGSIMVLSTVDGRLLWSYDAHAAVRSGPAVAGGLVALGDYAGDLLVFRPKS